MIDLNFQFAAFDALGSAGVSLNDRIEAELKKANQEIAREVGAESKRLLQSEIYDIPIPLKTSAEKRTKPGAAIRKKTTKGKLGRWQRTANLKRQESAVVEHGAVILRNNAEYAAARNALGGPPEINRAGRKSGAQSGKSQTRSIQWQRKAVENKRDFIRNAYAGAIKTALGVT